jgi:hypothetical protein
MTVRWMRRAARPAVLVEDDPVRRGGEPRFERDREARPEGEATAWTALVGDMGVLVHGAAESVAAELEVHRVSVRVGYGSDRRRDIAQAVPRLRGLDGGLEGHPGRADEPPVIFRGCADDHRDRRVGHPAVDSHGEIHAQDVAVTQPVVVRQPVQDRVVDGQADDVAERAAAEGRRVVPVAGLGPALVDAAADMVLQVEEVDTHVRETLELCQYLGHELTRDVHLLDLGGRLQLDHARPSRTTGPRRPVLLYRTVTV